MDGMLRKQTQKILMDCVTTSSAPKEERSRVISYPHAETASTSIQGEQISKLPFGTGNCLAIYLLLTKIYNDHTSTGAKHETFLCKIVVPDNMLGFVSRCL